MAEDSTAIRLQPSLGFKPIKLSSEARPKRQWKPDVQHGGRLPLRAANGTFPDPILVYGLLER
jgi:hypothetical protein